MVEHQVLVPDATSRGWTATVPGPSKTVSSFAVSRTRTAVPISRAGTEYGACRR